MPSDSEEREGEETEETPYSPDVHYEPIVHLEKVEVVTLEENEDVLLELHAKLFRYDLTMREWKERGTGEAKILKHKETGQHRLLMRRDKTHKICCNHFILEDMELKPNCGSDRAWVWNTYADFADEETKNELLAIRFRTVEDTKKFKDKFDEVKLLGDSNCTPKKKDVSKEEKTEDLVNKLKDLKFKEPAESVDDKENVDR